MPRSRLDSLGAIVFDSTTKAQLELLGRMDREDGVSKEDGWQKIAHLAGWDQYERTPAKEAYLDGYYAGAPK